MNLQPSAKTALILLVAESTAWSAVHVWWAGGVEEPGGCVGPAGEQARACELRSTRGTWVHGEIVRTGS